MKTLAPKGVARSPRLKEEQLEVLRIRFRFGRDSGNSGLRPNALYGSGKMLVIDRIQRNSRLKDMLCEIL
ncbi:hypothetical protein AAC387_Pa05g0965 [Persea americana]